MIPKKSQHAEGKMQLFMNRNKHLQIEKKTQTFKIHTSPSELIHFSIKYMICRNNVFVSLRTLRTLLWKRYLDTFVKELLLDSYFNLVEIREQRRSSRLQSKYFDKNERLWRQTFRKYEVAHEICLKVWNIRAVFFNFLSLISSYITTVHILTWNKV